MTTEEQALLILRKELSGSRTKAWWKVYITLSDPGLKKLVREHLALVKKISERKPDVPTLSNLRDSSISSPSGTLLKAQAKIKKVCGCGHPGPPHREREAIIAHMKYMRGIKLNKYRWLGLDREARCLATKPAREAKRAKEEERWFADINPRTLAILGKEAVIKQINAHRPPSRRIKL